MFRNSQLQLEAPKTAQVGCDLPKSIEPFLPSCGEMQEEGSGRWTMDPLRRKWGRTGGAGGAKGCAATCSPAPTHPLAAPRMPEQRVLQAILPQLCCLAPSQPTPASLSLQMWAPWKAWPITVAGTPSTGQATQHPPSPATQSTRPALGPLSVRRSLPCLETTTHGPLCWMSARSELLGARSGEGQATGWQKLPQAARVGGAQQERLAFP